MTGHAASSRGCTFTFRAVMRNLGRSRAAAVDPALLTDDPALALDDPAVRVVIEVMGGLEPARTLVLRALRAGH